MSSRREKNIKTAVFLNITFTIVEFVGGLWTNSLAILSNALHDLGDSVALIISWLAERKAKKPPDAKRTFGYRRLSLFSAFFAAIVLLTGSFIILINAIPRLFNPEHVNAPGMMGLAVVGIIFNGVAFFRLKKGESVNEKVLSWHLLEDVLSWIAILIGSIIIQVWNTYLIDPIMTFLFTAFIIRGVLKNLKETFNIFLQGVPAHINTKKLKNSLLAIDGIMDVHDMHIWSLEGETDIFTGHVVVKDELLQNPDHTRKRIKDALAKHHIEHSTIELETEEFCSGVECKDGSYNE